MMTATKTLEERLKDTALTKTDKKIADYLIDHQQTIGFGTVTQLALEIGVSDTSIIRLLRNLGYGGYTDFKQAMANQVMQQYLGLKDSMAPGEKYLRTSPSISKDDVIAKVMNKAVKNIQSAFTSTNLESLTAAVNYIIKSQKKYVIGFRGATSCSNFMARKMILLLPDVTCLDNAESSALEHIINITKNDCLIMYTFPRYSKINYLIMDIARKNGAKIILITDKITSPLATKADYVFTAPVVGAGMTVSYVVPMCISEAMLLLISKNMNKANKNRIELLDKIVSENELY